MSDTQQIKDKVDLAEFIGEYVQVKKAGVNWKACCPFHQEKTPSFMIQPEKQIWHCFGCGKGGDVFTFLEEIEGLEFPDALKILADRTGVQLTKQFKSEANKSERNRLFEINEKATYFFHSFLTEMPAAKEAMEYVLNARKIKPEIITEWKIGYAPNQWDLLTNYLLKKGFGIEELVSAGLTIKRDNANIVTGKGFYDRFRGRVMFPIFDIHGNTVGFTGRLLKEDEKAGGKYVNTPETLVYNKSQVLFGLDKAKMAIRQNDLAVMVEGQMDVVACHQAGMKNVIASSGTALTVEQIKLIKRYSTNLAMAFDSDSAGEKAAKRGIEIALAEGLSVKVISPDKSTGKDADEILQKNPEVWFDAVKTASHYIDWLLNLEMEKKNLNDPKQKQSAVNNLSEAVFRIPFSVERDEWLKKISEVLRVDLDVLREEIKNSQNKIKNKPISQPKTSVEKPVIKQAPVVVSRQEGLIENFFSLIFGWPDIFASVHPLLEFDYFKGTSFAGLYETSINHYNTNKGIDIEKLNLEFPDNKNIIDILVLKAQKDFSNFSLSNAEEELLKLFALIKKESVKRGKEDLLTELSQVQQNGESKEKERVILQKIMDLDKKILE